MKSVTRLTRLFIPDHYDLSLTLHRIERRFNGVVTISGTVPIDTSTIRLHAKDLTVQSVTIDGKEAAFAMEENDELVISHPDISIGKRIVIVSFEGVITDDMNGIYPCYFEVDGNKQELIATQFESHYARQAFPCIDEPEAKATFDITLTTEQNVTVLGNMPVVSQKVEGSHLVTRFGTTPRMSSYLVAWVVGDLQKKSTTTKSGVEVSIWSTKAHAASNLEFALDIATRTIDFFNHYFGVPYPLPKSDHVALPDFSSGAMENWGLITYREIALLVDPATTSLSTKQSAALVIAHELSHQWFGNLVTMQWWNDLWLNESFANMMEYVAIDALEPDWNIWLDQATNEVVSALRRDSLDGVQPIQIDVTHPDEISTIFDPSIVYAKGGRLLRMLQAYIGDEAMKQGLQHYFQTHQYTNTVADDLWNSLTKVVHKDIAKFMHAWMTQPGFPIVSASKEATTITITQRQFFIGPHKPSTRLWPIPLHGASPSIPEVLEHETLSFTYTDSAPFILNTGARAHFITHYDDSLFAAIVDAFPTLPPVDKLSILHEQLLLAKAGVQSYANLLPLLATFKNETNESVWSIVALAINELKRFVENDQAAERKLKGFVASLVTPQYERIGWDTISYEDENDTKLRSTIIGLSLYGELEDSMSEATKRYSINNLHSLDPELRAIIMGHAVRMQTPTSVVPSLIETYRKATQSELRDDIASALTSTKDLDTIKQLSKLLTDTSFIRPQDFVHWFVWLLRNRYGREYMWQWTRDNWDWIAKTFKGDSHYDMLPRYIASSLTTRTQLEEFKSFFGKLEKEITLKRTIVIGYTELEGIVTLIERDGPSVRSALLNLD